MNIRTLSRTNKGEAGGATGAPANRVPAPKRRWLARIGLPAAIVLATLGLLGYAAGDLLLPAEQVSVARATALPMQATSNGPAAVAPGPAKVVAQAPGWVEPDPYPIFVTTLADGVVEAVHVLEGETVEAGQTLVELVDDDARLVLSQARAELARRDAELAAARTDYEQPVGLERAVAVSRARLAEARAALTRLNADIAKEEAKLRELTVTHERLARLTREAVSELDLEAAQYQMQSQAAVVDATKQRRPELEARVEAAEAELRAAERELALKSQLRKKRDEAAAAVDAQRTKVEEAELRLSRMTLTAPSDGVVMERLVAPGTKLMLGMDGEHSAHAIHLYDPRSLQVRVDVPLVDAALVGLGQEAIVIVDVLPDVEFAGVVSRVVHQADLAKNTVQFKVAIKDPSPLLKPDMLARVKFLAGGGEDTEAEAGGQVAASGAGPAVAIRRSAIVKDGDNAFVWWISPTDQRLQQRTVTVGTERDDGMITIRDGLNPGDTVVDRPEADLEPGQRVRIAKQPE